MKKEEIIHPTILKYHGKGFERDIVVGLQTCINDHGPITRDRVSSATKRIWGAIKCRIKNFYSNTTCSRNEWLEIYQEQWAQLVDDNGDVTVPWQQLNIILCRAMERGEYLQLFEAANKEEQLEVR